MIDFLRSLTIAEWTAWVVVVALNAYVLFAGADFGGGVWDLLATGPRRRGQRELVSHAIGPIWEANHVWLIVVVVVLFVCFPPAFAAFGTILHIPLSLLLIGIVLRGSAFVFRAYSYGPRSEQRRWGQVFAVSSLVTPVVLGMGVGAVASGRVGEALAGVAHGPAAMLPSALDAASARESMTFVSIYVTPWISPFTIAVGALTLALFSFLAATYLTIEAEGQLELQEDFRRRALGSAVASMVTATIALALGATTGGVMARLVGVGWSLPLLIVSGLAGIGAVIALLQRRYQLARLAAGAWVTLVLWGWVMAQFPLIIPPGLTIEASAAPRRVLSDTLLVLAVGAVILIPSLWYLMRVFKSSPQGVSKSTPSTTTPHRSPR
jgi:cytochrome d ubiquinol oxidase subunit II